MPMISRIGRQTAVVRVQIATIYIILFLGALTMIYPFVVMVSGSFKSSVDINRYDIIPQYFYDDTVLFQKYEESKYNEQLTAYKMQTGEEIFSFSALKPHSEISIQKVTDWQEFIRASDMPLTWSHMACAFATGNKLLPEMDRRFKEHLSKLCKGKIEVFNQEFNQNLSSWLEITLPNERLFERGYLLNDTPIEKEFYKFKVMQLSQFRYYFSLDGVFRYNYLTYIYGTKISNFNQKHGTRYKSYNEIFLSSVAPSPDDPLCSDWENFVRNELNMQFIMVKEGASPYFYNFLSKRYENDIGLLNKNYNTQYQDFSEVPFPRELLVSSVPLTDWEQFLHDVPVEFIKLTGVEMVYRDYLIKKYKDDINAIRQAHQTSYPCFEQVSMPGRELDWVEMQENKKAAKWEFITRNYKMVLGYIVLHGRGIWNTTVYCLMAIFFALTVNPIAAYAMSRYNLPTTYKILFFLMATMAFPAAVTMIPNFLLLKQTHLLNTFWALVLPGVANGYMIFLLKGFFDSLPRELYEQGQIDGASEWTMFWKLTMALSKPILAVIALQAFTSAYGAFMFAFIVCQNPKMWTLMVWLYQLQQYSHQAVIFASLIVAAIPTFIVFLCCQNIIIRGIVVPQEK